MPLWHPLTGSWVCAPSSYQRWMEALRSARMSLTTWRRRAKVPSWTSACSRMMASGRDEVGEHSGHRGDAHAGTGEHGGAPGVVEHDLAVGHRHGEDVAPFDGVMQER